MMETKLKIAVCQLRTELEQGQTVAKAGDMVRQAAESGANIVVLPEMFHCPYDKSYFKAFARQGHEETVKQLSAWARDNGVLLVGGSVPEVEGEKIYNTCFVFDEAGQRIARHRKVHLFDIDVPGMRFKESNTFTPGDAVTVFDTKYGKMGVAVCFDVRFPELFRAMANRGAKVIFLPAQFNMETGPRHWELSLRARAVDNQVFFAAASAARYDGFSYECWGHSAVIDPYGEILASCDEKEQILYADIDLDRVEQVRRQLPTSQHLRRDVYEVAD